MIHAKAVLPFMNGNKTDATGARAIWLVIQQPGTKFVGVKTLMQQATLIRKCIYKTRDMARADIFDYIKPSYNGSRRHSHLGGVSPEAFERARA